MVTLTDLEPRTQVMKHCSAISAAAEPLVFIKTIDMKRKCVWAYWLWVNQGCPMWGTLSSGAR